MRRSDAMSVCDEQTQTDTFAIAKDKAYA